MTTSIGTKIRKIRELKNLKQEHLADKLGISVTAYGKIERDETDIGMERLEQIAHALDVSVQDIVAFDEKVLFNFFKSASGCGNISGYNINHNYNLPDSERKLYEDKIKLQEDMIGYLKTEIERLKANPGK